MYSVIYVWMDACVCFDLYLHSMARQLPCLQVKREGPPAGCLQLLIDAATYGDEQDKVW